MTSERAAMERMYTDIVEIRRQQSELLENLSRVSNDIEWLKSSTSDINEGLKGCAFCKSPAEILSKIGDNTKQIQLLKDSFTRTTGMVIGVSATVSFITAVIVLTLKIKEII